MSKPGNSLAQSRRDALVAAVEKRGKKTANIWMLYDPVKHDDVVIVSDPRMEHFYACQGDPDILSSDFEPESVQFVVAGETRNVRFDATVLFRDGHRECRHVRTSNNDRADIEKRTLAAAAAESVGASYVIVTLEDLNSQQQRIANWTRALGVLHRCRRRPLEVLELALNACLASREKLSLGSILDQFANSPAAIVLAAVVSLLCKRALQSDLDTKPWSRHTLVWKVEALS